MSSNIVLKRDIPLGRLNEMYATNYYWYLKSSQFQHTFLGPIGRTVDRLANEIGMPNNNCLDVGCGEGWLAGSITVPYLGIDGSEIAIDNARATYPQHRFKVARLEEFDCEERFGVVVLGGILHCMLVLDSYVPFLHLYKTRFGVKYFVVYDLEILETAGIEREFQLVEEWHASAGVKEIPKIKRDRKVMVFKC